MNNKEENFEKKETEPLTKTKQILKKKINEIIKKKSREITKIPKTEINLNNGDENGMVKEENLLVSMVEDKQTQKDKILSLIEEAITPKKSIKKNDMSFTTILKHSVSKGNILKDLPIPLTSQKNTNLSQILNSPSFDSLPNETNGTKNKEKKSEELTKILNSPNLDTKDLSECVKYISPIKKKKESQTSDRIDSTDLNFGEQPLLNFGIPSDLSAGDISSDFDSINVLNGKKTQIKVKLSKRPPPILILNKKDKLKRIQQRLNTMAIQFKQFQNNLNSICQELNEIIQNEPEPFLK